MKKTQALYHALLLGVGLVLVALGLGGVLDEFWNGMGFGLAAVGALRLLKDYRLNQNADYREKARVAASDERYHFIRAKAWSWAGYLFILITGLGVIAFKLAGNDVLCQAAAWAVCLMMILFWGSYHILKRKY